MTALANPNLEPKIPPGYDSAMSQVASNNDLEQSYTLIPSGQKGVFSTDHLSLIPISYIRGLGKAATAVASHYTGKETATDRRDPERLLVRNNEHVRLVLVTEPDPEQCDNFDEATNDVLMPGLSEMDIGSALLLHKAKAERHRERRVITIPTLGVSLSGQLLSIKEGYQRSLEETATDNLGLLPELVKDGQTNLLGTSLGSYVTTLMASQNLAANGHSQINLNGVRLISPAVGAKNIPENEKFHHVDAGDEEFVDEVTRRFFKHMPVDTARMAFNHPEMAAECVAIVGAYAMHPQKMPYRLAAMMGNLRGVQKGVDWQDLKDVARGYEIHVLGGELDPLVKEQLPQWSEIKKLAPSTQIRILQGLGHALTIDSQGTAEHLAQMENISEKQKTPLKLVR